MLIATDGGTPLSVVAARPLADFMGMPVDLGENLDCTFHRVDVDVNNLATQGYEGRPEALSPDTPAERGSGRITSKREPLPGALSTSMRPPWLTTMP